MAITVGLIFLALRRGLALRRRRQRGADKIPGALARHLVLARPAVLLAAVGLVSGPLSAVFLREWTPLQTLHGWLALLAAGLLLAAGFVGLRLSRGEEPGGGIARSARGIGRAGGGTGHLRGFRPAPLGGAPPRA